jgi:hypothetical protein
MTLINGLAVAIYLISSLYVMQKYKQYLVFFGFLTFAQSWALISCFYNDLGIYNIELFRFTSTSYATARLAGFYIVFNLGFLFLASLIGKHGLKRVDYRFLKNKINLGSLKLAAYIGIGAVVAYLIYVYCTKGVPISSGLNRLTFYQQAGPIERVLLTHGFLFAFFLGYFRKKRGRFSINGLLMCGYILFGILAGNKFSLFMLLLIPYFAPILARRYFRNPGLKIFRVKYAVIIAGTIIIFVSGAFITYNAALGDSDFALNHLVNRVFAWQGQMWWAVDYEYYNNALYDGRHLPVELQKIFSPESVPATDVGMKYLMITVLGPEIAYTIIERGYLYTMTYPAILIATVPYAVAVILQFLAGVIFFALLYYLHYSIVYRHTFRSIVAILMIVPYIAVLLTGNFAVFFTFSMSIKLLILLTLEMGVALRQVRVKGHDRQHISGLSQQ